MQNILLKIEDYFQFKTPLIWKNVFGLFVFYLLGFFSILEWRHCNKLASAWIFSVGFAADVAISAGAHRYWTHRAYKARLPLRIFAMLCYVCGGQYSLVQWVRDHRTHHKFADTDADPHNATRGFFFAHVGWLMMKRHPELIQKGKVIDVSDVWEDPVIRFHQKYFLELIVIFHIIFPSAVSYYVFGETLYYSILIGFIWRYFLSLNFLWLTNSLAHFWGYKPYNKNINASQTTMLAFFTLGEGYHNYHHTFPWDYRVGELSQRFKTSAYVIEFFAKLGLIYDLKTASPELIQKVVARQNLPRNYEVPESEFVKKYD